MAEIAGAGQPVQEVVDDSKVSQDTPDALEDHDDSVTETGHELDAILEKFSPEIAEQVRQAMRNVLLGQLGIGEKRTGEGDETRAEQDGTSGPVSKPILGVFKGPYDFHAFELGAVLDEFSASELKSLISSKAEACRIITVVVNWYNIVSRKYIETARENALLTAENEVLKEMKGRARQTSFGTGSERRTALEGQARDSTDSQTGVDEASKKDIECPDDKGAAKGGSDKDSKEDSGNGSDKEDARGETGKNDDSEGEDGKDGTGNESTPATDNPKVRPRRGKGCAEKVIEEAVHIPIHKAFSEEDLKELRKKGKLKKLSDGSYSMVVYISMPMVINVSYERFQNTDTKEIYKSDSAKESKMLSHSLQTISLLSAYLYQRVALGLPVTRLLKQFNATGLRFTKQTFYGWFIQYAMALARPLVMRLLETILESGKAQTDETWTKIREDLKNEGRHNSVLWMIRTSERLNIPPAVVVQYTGSRASKSFADMIRGYSLKLMSDGYSGYSALLKEFADSIELVGCLQHARSKFVDVIQALKGQNMYKKMSDKDRKALPVNQILDKFGEVFHYEDEMDVNASYEERKAYREDKVKKALDNLYELIDQEYSKLIPSVKGYMRTALEYAQSYKERFYAAVAEPDMPVHNSGSERVFAAYSILRNGYRQMDTVLGAESICMWFSIFQTAKENGVDEQIYIEFLLEELPSLLKEHGDYHYMAMKELKQLGLDNLPQYGDLAYLDVILPSGDKFKKYAETYKEKKLNQIIDISKIIQDAGLAG